MTWWSKALALALLAALAWAPARCLSACSQPADPPCHSKAPHHPEKPCPQHTALGSITTAIITVDSQQLHPEQAAAVSIAGVSHFALPWREIARSEPNRETQYFAPPLLTAVLRI